MNFACIRSPKAGRGTNEQEWKNEGGDENKRKVGLTVPDTS